jgi:hypothetical protein
LPKSLPEHHHSEHYGHLLPPRLYGQNAKYFLPIRTDITESFDLTILGKFGKSRRRRRDENLNKVHILKDNFSLLDSY